MMATTIEEMVKTAKAEIKEVSVDEARTMLGNGATFIDVREPPEWKDGTVPDALCIPRGVLEWKSADEDSLKDKSAQVVVYCKTGGRSALATLALKQLGYDNAVSMAGGYEAWSKGS